MNDSLRDTERPKPFAPAVDAHTLHFAAWTMHNDQPFRMREDSKVLRSIDELSTIKLEQGIPWDNFVIFELRAKGEATYHLPSPKNGARSIWFTYKLVKTRYADMLKLKDSQL